MAEQIYDEDRRKHPVLVYWEKSQRTDRYESIKECAEALETSTSQVKRLIQSNKSFDRGEDSCFIDSVFIL